MNISLKKQDFKLLESIRGIAALYVVIGHCRSILWMGGSEFLKAHPRATWGLFEYFQFGTSMLTRLAVEFVIVFFVLSGFSIAHSLASNPSPAEFYKRRFIRLYPSYLIALIWAGIIFVITRIIFPQWYDGSMTTIDFEYTMQMNSYLEPQTMIGNLFYMPMNGFITPFWSLTYEVIFYLLAPFILRRLNLYVIVSLMLYLANIVASRHLHSLNMPVYIYNYLFVFNIYFVVGILLYKYFSVALAKFGHIKKFVFWLLGMLLLGLMFAGNIYMQRDNLFTFFIAAIFAALLIFYFLRFQVTIPFLIKIGTFSYTLYISHFATVFLYLCLYWVISGERDILITNFFVWIPAIFFALFFAWLQYLLVEKNTLRVLSRMRKKV